VLVGVNEGMLPFKLGNESSSGAQTNPTGRADGQSKETGHDHGQNMGAGRDHGLVSDSITERLQEERRLMYVGITRAQRSLAVSWTRKRKKGRELIAAQPSRFIAEMALDKSTVREDPREKLKALRAEFAKKALVAADAKAIEKTGLT
jgi:ATP-dependent DNA helicase Rep